MVEKGIKKVEKKEKSSCVEKRDFVFSGVLNGYQFHNMPSVIGLYTLMPLFQM